MPMKPAGWCSSACRIRAATAGICGPSSLRPWSYSSSTRACAHDVPEEHLGSVATGILNVDRYSAYKALPQVKSGRVVLAFCWAHQRCDFVAVAKDWPAEQAWALTWLTAIGELYHLNNRRLEVREDSEAFAQRDQDLRQAMAAFQQRWQAEGAEAPLHPGAAESAEKLSPTLVRLDRVRGLSGHPDGQ